MSGKSRLFWLLLLSLVGHLTLVALLPADGRWVESVFAGRFYPAVAPVAAFLPGLVPVSVASILIALLIVWVPGYLTLNLIRWRRARSTGLRVALLRTLAGYLVVLTLIFHSFFLLWGYHYLRPPLERRLGFASRAPAPEALAKTAHQAVEAVNAARVEVGPWDFRALDALLDPALDRAVRRLENRPLPFRGRIKAPLPHGLLAAFGTQGVISPWTLEAHVDPGLPPVILAFTAAHEKAHLAGYAPERDASFVAWLALTESDDARLRYAGHLGVIGWFLRADNFNKLSPQVLADLAAIREHHERHAAEWLEAPSRSVYRVYLKANRVVAGLGDYSRVAELICRWQTSRPAVDSKQARDSRSSDP